MSKISQRELKVFYGLMTGKKDSTTPRKHCRTWDILNAIEQENTKQVN